jgi:uncharacterized protein YrrD
LVDRVALTERLEIRTGAPVYAAGEYVGVVERIVYRPGGGEVAAIVVGSSDVLPYSVAVPIDAVESADTERVRVSLGPVEVVHLPPAQPDGGEVGASLERPGLLRTASSGQLGAMAGGRPLRAGQRVVATDGDVGTLDLVLIDPRTDRATGFVVRKGRLFGRDVIVPARWIRSVDRDEIRLGVPKAMLDRLPEFRPDDEITRDVLDALWYGTRLKPADVQFVEVRTRDGIVELSGQTYTRHARKAIEEVARGVRGVVEVRNYIDTFEDLEAALREARRAAGREPAPETARAATR